MKNFPFRNNLPRLFKVLYRRESARLTAPWGAGEPSSRISSGRPRRVQAA
jgi:hypothetical protein